MFFPLLNSDHAVNVLLTYYYQFPQDLYTWGMDKLGTLIPLIGQFFFKILHLSALTSESIVHYILLLLGCLSFIHFIKSPAIKIAFAILWFFPPMRLIDVTQFAFGIHYCLIAMACYLFDCTTKTKLRKRQFYHHLTLSLIVLLLISAIWVSDMALISVFLLLAVQVYFYFQTHPFNTSIFKKAELYYAIGGIVLGFLFIRYGKTHCWHRYNYATFATLHQIIHSFSILGRTVGDILLFRSEPFTSVYCYLVMILLIVLATQVKKIKLSQNVRKWVLFFFLDAVFLFGAIMFSRWTYYNDTPRRYFTCTYISISFGIILLLDNLLLDKKNSAIITILLLITVIEGGVGSFLQIKYFWPKTLTPRVEISREFEKLGQIGLIADYWDAYVNSCVNPTMIKAIPRENCAIIASNKIMSEFYEQENIYVIGNNWLNVFPDTLTQYGIKMIRDGEEINVEKYTICKYKRLHEQPDTLR